MRLLIITQSVDRDDTVLGFMHGWVAALAEKFSAVTVICLRRGRVELLPNIPIVSLGKERGGNRLSYIINFYRAIIGRTTTYDEVFVHMNPEYVLLGWWWWRLTGKKIVLWYNHPRGSWAARIARHLVDSVVCTSPYAYAMRWRGTQRMPVGVDTKLFLSRATSIEKNRVVYVGRISPVKKIEVLVDAIKILHARGCAPSVHLYGDPTDADAAYNNVIHARAEELARFGVIEFHHGVPYDALPEIFSVTHIVVNMTPTGSFDKTIIEACACARPVLVSNRALAGVLPAVCVFKENDAASMAAQLQTLLGLSSEELERIGIAARAYAVEHEGLDALVKKLYVLFSQLRHGF